MTEYPALTFIEDPGELLNMYQCRDRTRHLLAGARRNNEIIASLVIGIRGNQHECDDSARNCNRAMRRMIVQRLKQAVRNVDPLAIMEKQVFIVVLGKLHTEREAVVVQGRIKNALEMPYGVDGIVIKPAFDYRLLLFPRDVADVGGLLATPFGIQTRPG